MHSIDLEALKADILDFGRIGFDERDGGIHRPGFSKADMAARRLLLEKLESEGFSARMDSAGNVIGRLGSARGACVMLGSHLDSVPSGGMFDGALGVLAGLECLRRIREAGVDLVYAVELVATAEEEGRFGGMLGSQAMTDTVNPAWLTSARDEQGVSLREAMASAGLDVDRLSEAARVPDDIRAFLELHVEQGPVLESRGIPIGIVESVSGCFNWEVSLEGRSNHAGTTPMDMRRDALVAAAEFIAGIDTIIAEHGTEQSRVTVGQLDVTPNFPHTVPGAAGFTVIGRDPEAGVMDALEAAIRARLAITAQGRGLKLQIAEKSRLEPVRCSPQVVAAMAGCARLRGYTHLVMPSGAGHDAQTFTAICDAGIVFVPSIGGVSHSPAERTAWTDIEKGANLLLDTALAFATGRRDQG